MKKDDHVPHINVDYFSDLTGDISNPGDQNVEAIGEKICKLREEKGISLEELSNMTGFDIDLLSNIEKNEIQPQLGTIIRLSQALDSAFSRLVSGVGTNYIPLQEKMRLKRFQDRRHVRAKNNFTHIKALLLK